VVAGHAVYQRTFSLEMRMSTVSLKLTARVIICHRCFYTCETFLIQCLEFADKILIFAALEQSLLQVRETASSFVFIIFAVLLRKTESAA